MVTPNSRIDESPANTNRDGAFTCQARPTCSSLRQGTEEYNHSTSLDSGQPQLREPDQPWNWCRCAAAISAQFVCTFKPIKLGGPSHAVHGQPHGRFARLSMLAAGVDSREVGSGARKTMNARVPALSSTLAILSLTTSSRRALYSLAWSVATMTLRRGGITLVPVSRLFQRVRVSTA